MILLCRIFIITIFDLSLVIIYLLFHLPNDNKFRRLKEKDNMFTMEWLVQGYILSKTYSFLL